MGRAADKRYSLALKIMLIHFTKSIEALDSILRTGFLYLHNETGILGPALQKAFGISGGDEQSSGMICFTELQPEHTHAHQNKYGKFGVGVSKNWLVKSNAKKVEYVKPGSEQFYQYVNLVKRHAPKDINGRPIAKLLSEPENRFMVTQALSGDFMHAPDRNQNGPYVQLIEKLSWTQTHADSVDLEWRIRNRKPYAFKGNPTRKQQIDLLVNCVHDNNIPDFCEGVMLYTTDCKIELVTTGKMSLVLPLPKEQIQAIFCPNSHHEIVASAFNHSGLGHIPIYTS